MIGFNANLGVEKFGMTGFLGNFDIPDPKQSGN